MIPGAESRWGPCQHVPHGQSVTAGRLNSSPHAHCTVCDRPECVAACVAWAEAETGLPARVRRARLVALPPLRVLRPGPVAFGARRVSLSVGPRAAAYWKAKK